MEAKEYWKEKELKKGTSEEDIDNIVDDMNDVFQLMEDYATYRERKQANKIIELLKFTQIISDEPT